MEQHAEIALSLTEDAVVLERGAIVHRARSADLLKDHATLDRYIGLRVEGGSTNPQAASHALMLRSIAKPLRTLLG